LILLLSVWDDHQSHGEPDFIYWRVNSIVSRSWFAWRLCSARLQGAIDDRTKTQRLSASSCVLRTKLRPGRVEKQIVGFDLSDTAPWLDRVARSTDDLGFHETCVEYVASLNDSPARFSIPSMDWSASLGFTVDGYDSGRWHACLLAPSICLTTGSSLIDTIDRNRLRHHLPDNYACP
jgi:hypothetical protein